MRPPVIGVVDRDTVAVDRIGRKDHQIDAAGVVQRQEQDASKPARDYTASFYEGGIFLSMRAIRRNPAAVRKKLPKTSQPVSCWNPLVPTINVLG